VALALFDDAERVAEVLPRLESGGEAGSAAAFRLCEGESEAADAIAPVDLVRQSSRLAAWIRGQA
jgi:hypothetical protein